MADSVEARLRAHVGSSQMREDLRESRLRKSAARGGPQSYALSIATITYVDYEDLLVNLRIESGETFNRVSIPLSFPGAGARHFLGSVPEVGDACVVGWGSMESGRTQLPYILSWLIPGTTAGYDWLPTQPFGPDEFGTTPKSRFYLEGLADRIRHKLRHMEPGNVVASSSQGSDLVLNESVLLTNRRGAEIRLEDRDNSLIVRSLQQFHAGGGFRVYAGMVQRDARFLPTQVFSDGTDYAAPRQVDAEGNILTEDELADSSYRRGRLTPARVFQRDDTGKVEVNLSFGANVDPNDFLRNGLLINANGDALGTLHSDAIYGGKHIYRVSVDGTNGAVDTGAETLTEWRLEMSHTHDGTIPVTEQTDGFDADRLPSSATQGPNPTGVSGNAPFLTVAFGSVVGNDPFTATGRPLYGQPLKPVIFDGESRRPAMVSGVGSSIESHAAFLLQVRPPFGGTRPPSFLTITKDGRLLGSLAGPGKTWSGELAFGSGLKLGAGSNATGTGVQVLSDGAVDISAKAGRRSDNAGIVARTEGGGVYIYGGAPLSLGGPGSRVAAAPGGGRETAPSVVVEAATNLLLKGGRSIRFEATTLDYNNLQTFNVNANGSIIGQAGDTISFSSKVYNHTTTGKAVYTYSGPKDGDPSAGALRETKFTAGPSTGFTGGVADKYTLEYGDREEVIKQGDHTTEVRVGDATYKVGTGKMTLEAEQAKIEMSNSGIDGEAGQGSIKFKAKAGSATFEASTTVTLKGSQMELQADSITFKSINGNHTPPGGLSNGGMLTDGVLNPLTGSAFSQTGTLGIATIRVQ